MNLTAETDPGKLLRLHFLEAFWASREFFVPGLRFADVGTGAGFPGMAMKLYRPGLKATLIEKNYKKAVFLRHLAGQLALDVDVFHGTAEEFPGWFS